jgi:hypothetical protein
MDLVVLAGSPEWTGGPVERIYRELIRYPDVPLLSLGVGGTGPGVVLSAIEREVYLRENSLIVCRNPILARDIEAQLGADRVRLLPCPAFFCSPASEPRTAASFADTLRAVGLQGDSVVNQSAPSSLIEELQRYMLQRDEEDEVRYVAHYIDEFLRFSRLDQRADIFYSYEPFDYVEFYREGVKCLITSRLNGAIAALSCGTPAYLVDFGNSRVNDTAVPFRGCLPNLPLREAIERARALSEGECSDLSQRIMKFKQETFSAYRSILRRFLDRPLRLAG